MLNKIGVYACVLGPSPKIAQHIDVEQDRGKRLCSFSESLAAHSGLFFMVVFEPTADFCSRLWRALFLTLSLGCFRLRILHSRLSCPNSGGLAQRLRSGVQPKTPAHRSPCNKLPPQMVPNRARKCRTLHSATAWPQWGLKRGAKGKFAINCTNFESGPKPNPGMFDESGISVFGVWTVRVLGLGRVWARVLGSGPEPGAWFKSVGKSQKTCNGSGSGFWVSLRSGLSIPRLDGGGNFNSTFPTL